MVRNDQGVMNGKQMARGQFTWAYQKPIFDGYKRVFNQDTKSPSLRQAKNGQLQAKIGRE